jgi:hypothetical protein
VGRTDGIPLFVEEMTKAVLEAQSEAVTPALTIPASLHGSLMARLDRLGSAKEVAQIGSAIGREFSDALLAAVVDKPAAELGSALNNLVAAGLLLRQGLPPHSTYLFKHALVQDAAYGTLLREPRRALHARIVETLENQFAEIAKANRSCSLNIATLPSGPRRPLFTGAQQASRLRTAQPMSKQSSIFAARCFAMLSEPRVPTVCAPNLQFCPSSGRH